MKRRLFFSSFLGGLLAVPAGLKGKILSAVPSTLPDLPNLARPESDEGYWKLVRMWFPLAPDKIYFNTGALGPSHYLVLNTLTEETLRLEMKGEHEHRLVQGTTEKMAAFLKAAPEEIALTRNTTEGMNIIARGLPLKRGDEILTSTHEHVGGAIPWLALANDIGVKINLFEPALTASENLNLIESHLTKRTRVVSLSHITCTTGLKFPAKQIARLCHDRNIIFVLDGAHPPGMVPVDLHELECDFYAASGHKWLMGPKGTGILYIRNEMFDFWKPTHVGAYSGEENYSLEQRRFINQKKANSTEYGTRNTAVSLALGAAIDFINTIGQEKIATRGRIMADYFRERLLTEIPEIDILTPSETDAYASIITIRSRRFNHLQLQQMIAARQSIRTRTVEEHGLNAIRCSFHVFNNFDEIDLFVETLKDIFKV